MRPILLATFAFTLSACSTFSFAPPPVSVDRVDTGRLASVSCAPSQNGHTIPHTVLGAQMLIDNFVDGYRCAAHSAANGRQLFEVPSFLALTGSALAVALGAGTDVAIVSSAANSVLTGAKAYYVPAEKAAVLDHALDALLCIKTESVGVDAYSIGKEGERQLPRLNRKDLGSVKIPVDVQYFNMVAAALLSVERIMAQKLSTLGTPFDAEGIAAQIKENAKAIQDAENKRNAGQSRQYRGGGEMTLKDATLELGVLQKKLQDCIVRAKI